MSQPRCKELAKGRGTSESAGMLNTGGIRGKTSDRDYRHWVAALDLHHGLSSRTWLLTLAETSQKGVSFPQGLNYQGLVQRSRLDEEQ